MKNQLEDIRIAGRQLFIYLPINYERDNQSYPVVYVNGDESTKFIIEEADYISGLNMIIVSIVSENRLSELTPWPAKALHPKFLDFGGKADEFIHDIENQLKPEIDKRYRTLKGPESTGITGYSLGGLFAIYSAYHTKIFGSIASMSGSFWYPDFLIYVKEHSMLNITARLYLSSGDSEGLGHNDIKKDSVLYTREIHHLLEEHTSSKVVLQWHTGGHHDNKEDRYRDMLLWFESKLDHSFM